MADARTVLVVDVGGTHVKLLTSNADEPRRFESGPEMTPEQAVEGVRNAIHGWSCQLEELPPNARRGGNEAAFTGGFRLWEPAWSPRPGAGEPS